MSLTQQKINWPSRLHAAELYIHQLITYLKEDGERGAAVLAEWDAERGHSWDKSQADAQWIVTQCLPILRAGVPESAVPPQAF